MLKKILWKLELLKYDINFLASPIRPFEGNYSIIPLYKLLSYHYILVNFGILKLFVL